MGHQVDGDADHEKQGVGKKASSAGNGWVPSQGGWLGEADIGVCSPVSEVSAVFEGIGVLLGRHAKWGESEIALGTEGTGRARGLNAQ